MQATYSTFFYMKHASILRIAMLLHVIEFLKTNFKTHAYLFWKVFYLPVIYTIYVYLKFILKIKS